MYIILRNLLENNNEILANIVFYPISNKIENGISRYNMYTFEYTSTLIIYITVNWWVPTIIVGTQIINKNNKYFN